MPIRYVGRQSHFHGKSIFEIARNLKNFGEGRYVYRVSFTKRYKEPSFYKLTSVVPDMNAKGYCFGTASGEKVFRGKNMGNCVIDSGMKHDWRLIPKDEEHIWLEAAKNCEVQPNIIVQDKRRLPPLMEKIFIEEMLADGLKLDESEIYCESVIKKGRFSKAFLKQGEQTVAGETKV